MPQTMRTREEEVLLTLTEHALKIHDLQAVDAKLDSRILILERLLLLGEDDRKPLVQVIRDIETRLTEFMKSRAEKDKEEAEANTKKLASDEANRQFMKRAFITAIVGFFFTVILPSIWQIIQFWTKVYPILERLSNTP